MATAPPPAAATSAAPNAHHARRGAMPTKGPDFCKHRRDSSLWVPQSRPIEPVHLIRHKTEASKQQISDFFGRRCFFCCPRSQGEPEWRTVLPNPKYDASTPRYQHPNRSRYADNRIRTTKYSLLSFLPKNLFEQFHRIANLYFILIVTLNWFPIFEAFSKYLGMIPISLILLLTAIKDGFEDWRRYKSDQKINHATCRVWDNEKQRYRKLEWRHVLVGDMVHLSCNEIIPADILMLRSSDPLGICYVETSNLDGESNLKQRQIVPSMAEYSGPDSNFKPTDFSGKVECEKPNNQIYRFNGKMHYEDGSIEPLSKDNLLLRGCQLRNTDFCEGLVIYAGKDTKAMLNNSGPRYKRSGLERSTNFDILWCVLILVVMCTTGAVFSMVWLNNFLDDSGNFPDVPFLTIKNVSAQLAALENFGSFIISLQILIPLSLYISIELVKLGQVYFMSQDAQLYYEPSDKRIQCRALNIPEELGQIQFVMSDKTGTLTENKMIFRRCGVAGVDYGPPDDEESSPGPFPGISGKNAAGCSVSVPSTENEQDVKANEELVHRVAQATDGMFQSLNTASCARPICPEEADIYHFFVNMALCNTVVVNSHPHFDRMNESGFFVDDTFVTGNSEFHVGSSGSVTMVESFDSPSTPSTSCSQLLETPTSHNAGRFLPVPNRRQASLTPVGSQSYISFDCHASRSMNPEETSPTTQLGNEQVMETSFFVPQAGTMESFAEEPEQSAETDTDQQQDTPTHAMPTSPLSSFKLGRNLLKLNVKMKSVRPLSLLKKGKQESVESPLPPANPIYEAESPDELSLVYAASAYGVQLLKRHVGHVSVGIPGGRMQRFQVLFTLPFDSQRKRMSVIVMPPGSSRPVLYCKGADSAIMEVLSDSFKSSSHGEMVIYKSQQFLNEYSSYGLRTLCLAKRELEETEYRQWKLLHEVAEMDMENRAELIFESAMRIEKDLELVGVTGIEDRLQDGVAECIEALREGGMNVWVLTGDKIETAVNIAYASRLFYPHMELLELCTAIEENIPELLETCIEKVEAERTVAGLRPEYGLVVSGQTLAYCFNPVNKEKFVRLVSKCISVLCCRTTPLQKAAVVRLAKERFKGKVLAIGDGANDVSMIQCADVGVGISGQEGMQAVMASDFALARFRFLQRLLLVHGHWCYDRLARTILYFLYKNAVFVFTIFWCQLFNGFSAQSPMDPIFMMIFPIIFTSVPPIVYGVCEQDSPDSLLMRLPRLYALGRKGKLYRWYSFWINMADALWQSLAIYFIAHYTYIDSDCSMWSFGFLLCTDLLIINNLHLAVEVRLWTLPVLLSLTLSVLVYFVMALLYNWLVGPAWGIKSPPNMVAQFAMGDVHFWAALILTCVMALLPRLVFHVLLNVFFPSDVIVERLKLQSIDESVDADRIPFVQRVSDWWQKKEKIMDVEVVPNIVVQIDNQIVVSPTYQL